MRGITRLFLASFLAFTFAILGATLSPSTSSAEDVWFNSNGEFSYYLDTNTIKRNPNSHPPYTYNNPPMYTCSFKIVHHGKYENFQICGFAKENDKVIGYSFSRSMGDWSNEGSVINNPFYNALWNAMKKYI